MFPKLSTTQTVAGNLTESSVDDTAVAGGQEYPVGVVDVVVTTEVETVLELAVCASAADGRHERYEQQKRRDYQQACLLHL